jgi:acyl-homoserine-lactone acylase
MYADRTDSIFYMSLAKIQLRPKDGLIKNGIMLGDTSGLLSKGYLSYESLPKLLNPEHGYLFNTNNSPYNCAHTEDNIDSKDFENYQLGYKEDYNNRSLRFEDLIRDKEELSMDDFFQIKYDIQYPEKIWTPSGASLIFNVDELKYPDHSNLVHIIKNWNHRADTTNVGAAQWAIYYRNYLDFKSGGYENDVLMKKTLKKTQKHLIKNFGRIDIQLREYQRHNRGTKEIAVPGLSDMIAAMTTVPFKKGRAKPVHGESYIMIVQYDDDGVEIETVLPYGNSRRTDGPHFTDQMEMYAKQQRKKMSLDLNEAIKGAVKSYHPR